MGGEGQGMAGADRARQRAGDYVLGSLPFEPLLGAEVGPPGYLSCVGETESLTGVDTMKCVLRRMDILHISIGF